MDDERSTNSADNTQNNSADEQSTNSADEQSTNSSKRKQKHDLKKISEKDIPELDFEVTFDLLTDPRVTEEYYVGELIYDPCEEIYERAKYINCIPQDNRAQITIKQIEEGYATDLNGKSLKDFYTGKKYKRMIGMTFHEWNAANISPLRIVHPTPFTIQIPNFFMDKVQTGLPYKNGDEVGTYSAAALLTILKKKNIPGIEFTTPSTIFQGYKVLKEGKSKCSAFKWDMNNPQYRFFYYEVIMAAILKISEYIAKSPGTFGFGTLRAITDEDIAAKNDRWKASVKTISDAIKAVARFPEISEKNPDLDSCIRQGAVNLINRPADLENGKKAFKTNIFIVKKGKSIPISHRKFEEIMSGIEYDAEGKKFQAKEKFFEGSATFTIGRITYTNNVSAKPTWKALYITRIFDAIDYTRRDEAHANELSMQENINEDFKKYIADGEGFGNDDEVAKEDTRKKFSMNKSENLKTSYKSDDDTNIPSGDEKKKKRSDSSKTKNKNRKSKNEEDTVVDSDDDRNKKNKGKKSKNEEDAVVDSDDDRNKKNKGKKSKNEEDTVVDSDDDRNKKNKNRKSKNEEDTVVDSDDDRNKKNKGKKSKNEEDTVVDSDDDRNKKNKGKKSKNEEDTVVDSDDDRNKKGKNRKSKNEEDTVVDSDDDRSKRRSKNEKNKKDKNNSENESVSDDDRNKKNKNRNSQKRDDDDVSILTEATNTTGITKNRKTSNKSSSQKNDDSDTVRNKKSGKRNYNSSEEENSSSGEESA